MWRVQRGTKARRQILVSTHSYEMLSDKGIRPSEILILEPGRGEGTQVRNVGDVPELRDLIRNGLSPADSVLPRTRPASLEQLSFFRPFSRHAVESTALHGGRHKLSPANYPNTSAHAFSRKPARATPSPRTKGRLTSMPLPARRSRASSSVIPGSLSLSPWAR